MFSFRGGSGRPTLILTLLLVSLVVALFNHSPAAVATSVPSSQPDTIIVRISPDEWADFSQTLTAVNLIDYDTYLWIELDSAGFAQLQSGNAAGNAAYQQQVNPFHLTLGEQTFDPRQAPPQLPAGWDTAAGNGPDFHLVQLHGPTRSGWLADLAAQNLEIVQYIHPYTYVVWGENISQQTQNLTFVRWTGPFVAAYKVLPQWQNLPAEIVPVDVLLYRGADVDTAVAQLEQIGRVYGRAVLNATWEVVGVNLNGDQLQTAAHIPGVYSIQPLPTDGGLRGEMSNQINVNNHDESNLAFPGYATWLNSVGLDGSGVIMANVDSGVQASHPDLVNRMLPCTGSTCSGTSSSHGTHTAAIMAADGSSGVVDSFGFLRGQGVAPGANLIEQVYSSYNQPGGMLYLMTESYRNDAVLSGNSWGPAGTPQGYDNHTMQVDIGVRDADPDEPGNQAFTYVLSIMNGNGGTSSQGSPDEAKNIFTIGSTKMQNTNGS
jgi:serine protease AprX